MSFKLDCAIGAEIERVLAAAGWTKNDIKLFCCSDRLDSFIDVLRGYSVVTSATNGTPARRNKKTTGGRQPLVMRMQDGILLESAFNKFGWGVPNINLLLRANPRRLRLVRDIMRGESVISKTDVISSLAKPCVHNPSMSPWASPWQIIRHDKHRTFQWDERLVEVVPITNVDEIKGLPHLNACVFDFLWDHQKTIPPSWSEKLDERDRHSAPKIAFFGTVLHDHFSFVRSLHFDGHSWWNSEVRLDYGLKYRNIFAAVFKDG
ncbi:MAG: hypothetical protein Q8O87_01190 [bacterium]|nr:hypothetical protein [bacterium]